jgi:SnoaL-like domain
MMRGFSFIRNAAAIALVTGAAGVVGAVSGAGTGASAAGADRTADIVAIQTTQACYGRAQDVVYRNYANRHRAVSEGVAAFEQCFTPGADVTITLHGTKVLDHAKNIGAWTQFVYQFGHTNGITSTRHLLGNIEVKLTGPDRGFVYSAAITPHFVGQGVGAKHPAILWIIANYRGVVHRINGRWLITSFRINADEAARANVTYPLGVSNGNGNIGFPDPSAGTNSGRR